MRGAKLDSSERDAFLAEAESAERSACTQNRPNRTLVPQDGAGIEEPRRQMALVNLASALRDEAPGSVDPVEDLHFFDLGDIVAASSSNTRLLEVRVTDHFDDDGSKVAETLGLSGTQIEASSLEPTVLPPGKGFASAVRVSSGSSGWVGSSNGSIRLTWFKDNVVDSNHSDDWYIYTVYTRAVPAHHWANRRFVGDIDTISYVTNSSAWKVKDDRVLAGVTAHNSNSCGDTVGLGVKAVSYETSGCDDNYEKGDRFGGLHAEFRSRSYACQVVGSGCPLWNLPDWGTPVESGFSIEIKVIQGTVPYWSDYGDAYFRSEWSSSSEPSTN